MTTVTINGPALSNDTPGLLAAIASVPKGGTLRIEGALAINQPLLIDRDISVVCESRDDFICPSLTTTDDAITIRGPIQGFKRLRIALNVFGLANACKNALVLERVDSSDIDLEVRCGAAQYAVQLLGCLSNDVRVMSSVNGGTPYEPPPGQAIAFQAHHLFVGCALRFETDASGTPQPRIIFTNANRIRLCLEGGGRGLVADDNLDPAANKGLRGEANNLYTGTIEGVQDTPIRLKTCGSVMLSALHLEENPQPSIIESCVNLRIESVRNPLGRFSLRSCRSVSIDNYHGSLSIDETSSGVTLGRILLDDTDTVVDLSTSAEAAGGAASLSSHPIVMSGTIAQSSGENIFCNPFLDIWSNGPRGAPDGVEFQSPGGLNFMVRRNDQISWPDSPIGISLEVTLSAEQDRGPSFSLARTWADSTKSRWLSFLIPIIVRQGLPLELYAVASDRAQYPDRLITEIATLGQWVSLRGSAKCQPTFAYFELRMKSSGVRKDTNFLIGGCSIVEGNIPPKGLCDHGRRSEHVVRSVLHPPAFDGQRAVVQDKQKKALYVGVNYGAKPNWHKIAEFNQ